ncbi:MAG: hypothetical protein JST80_02905 [Bdellovibrionales bacterium]|nr:hypothetical protein [Bdellovibrionales bacterium]
MNTLGINITVIVLSLFMTVASLAADPASKSKYGPHTTPVSEDHAFLQRKPAPDYWALSPYYVPQRDSASCTLASFADVFNAFRSFKKLGADDKTITQDEILTKVNHPGWNRHFKGYAAKQKFKTVTLDELGEIAARALSIYGIEGKVVDVVHVDYTDATSEKKSMATVQDILIKNEKSPNDMVIVNALQGELTGDSEGMVGHAAPVGAYDAVKKRVLIMDPDREYYEPYWVDLSMLMKGMNTLDKDAGKNRGLIWIRPQ